MWTHISRDKLVERGIYDCPRQRRLFDEVFTKEDDFSCEENDAAMLNKRVVLMIEQAMLISSDLPGYTSDMELIVPDADPPSVPKRIIVLGDQQQHNLGADTLLDEDEAATVDAYNEAGEVMTPSEIQRFDLCSKEVVRAIERFGAKVVRDTLERAERQGVEDAMQPLELRGEIPTPIMEHTGPLSSCDGSPSIAIIRIHDERVTMQRAAASAGDVRRDGGSSGSGSDESDDDDDGDLFAANAVDRARERRAAQRFRRRRREERGDSDRLHNLSGGFHHMLEFLRMRGRMFEHTHLRAFFWQWRPSEPRMG